MEGKSSMQPWLQIFTRPREVAKQICALTPNKGLLAISAVYGFFVLIETMQNIGAGLQYKLEAILLFALVLAIPIGYLSLSFSAWMLWWTGKLIKGQANFVTIRSALTWSKIPELVALIGWFVMIAVYGLQVFVPAFIDKSYTFNQFSLPTTVMVLQIGFTLWGFIALLQTLAEVQKFSIWYALLNVVLKSLLLAIFGAALMWFSGGYVA